MLLGTDCLGRISMAKFNRNARVLFVEGTYLHRTYQPLAVLISLDNVWDIKFLESFQKDNIQYYEMYVYYTKNETERHMMITEAEYEQIKTLIGGGPY